MTLNVDPIELTVINLWAGPGAGKSTTAAGLFNLMKTLGLRVELVTEYAKDLTYKRDYGSLRNQLMILAQQDDRLRRLVGQVDFAITDSPLPLGEAYMTPEYEGWLPAAVKAAYSRYTNYDFFVLRDKEYQPYGRNQTESEARALDHVIADIFKKHTGGVGGGYLAWLVKGNPDAPYAIARKLGLDV